MDTKLLYVTKTYFVVMALAGAVCFYKAHRNMKAFNEETAALDAALAEPMPKLIPNI